MNRPILFALMTLNVFFAGILLSEWLVITNETQAIPFMDARNNEPENEVLPSLDFTALSETNYSDLVDRPLFIKGRKLVQEPEPENVSATVAEPVKELKMLTWELIGIFTTPKTTTAFFSRTNAKVPKDNFRKYKLDDELEGWKLTEIHSDKVALTNGNETKILLLRKNKPKMLIPVNNNPQPSPPPQPVVLQQVSAPPVPVLPPIMPSQSTHQNVAPAVEPVINEDETVQP